MEFLRKAQAFIDDMRNPDIEKEVYVPATDEASHCKLVEEEMQKIKTFLSVRSPILHISMYDHLRNMIVKIFRDKIANAVDVMEDISLILKSQTYPTKSLFVEKTADTKQFAEQVDVIKLLFRELQDKDINAPIKEPDEDIEKILEEEDVNNPSKINDGGGDTWDMDNVMCDFFYHVFRFRQAGIGFSEEEAFKIVFALNTLAKTYKLQKVRFWGKIIGLKNNYYIAETPYREDIIPDNFVIEIKKVEKAVESFELEKEAGKEVERDTVSSESEKQTKTDSEPIKESEKVVENSDPEKKAENSEPKEEAEKDAENSEPNKETEKDEENKDDSELKETTPGEEKGEEDADKPKLIEIHLPPIPVPMPKPVVEVPAEENGTGVNENLYFVCTSLGSPWMCLPQLKPAHITSARLFKKFFTGNLYEEVISGVPFEGKEAHYLRAQIARISAATIISPADFYCIPEDEVAEVEIKPEEAVEIPSAEVKKPYVVENPNYIPLSPLKCLEQNLMGFVHCKKSILLNGRCSIVKKVEASETVESDQTNVENKEKIEEDVDEDENEIPVLRPLGEDNGAGGVVPWSLFLNSKYLKSLAILLARSNIWPGAFTYYDGKMHQHLYVGYGHKYVARHYVPFISEIYEEEEYVLGPDEVEIESIPLSAVPDAADETTETRKESTVQSN